MLKKDEAICIRTLDYSETSQIVTLFAKEHGKIDAMAKGSKRAKSPFDGPIEIFSYGRIVFSEKGDQKLSSLAEFAQQPRFLALRTKLFSLNCALFAAELIESFTVEFDPHPELFESMLEFLQNQIDARDQTQSLSELISFQLALLRHIGGGLVLDQCVNCKRDYNARWPDAYFSSSSHGFICRDCEASFPDRVHLDKNTAEFLAANCNESKIQNVKSKVDLRQIEKMLIYHFSNLLHRAPKMASYFTQQA